jgi:hypothetical protein
MKLWCVGIAHGSVARYGTPQDVAWRASGTGLNTGIKKILDKKKPRRSGAKFSYSMKLRSNFKTF